MEFKFVKMTHCYGVMYVVICRFVCLLAFSNTFFFGHCIKSDASEFLVIFLTSVNEIFRSIYECCLLCYSTKSVKNMLKQYECNFYLVISLVVY